MNKNKLVGVMHANGDSQEALATAIGLSKSRFNAKLNEYGGAEFTQGEIKLIKNRYELAPSEVDEIFFTENVS